MPEDLSSKTFFVFDHHGLFIGVAKRLSDTGARVFYQTPQDRRDLLNDGVVGDGITGIEWCDDLWRIKQKHTIDCYVFPDVRHCGEQLELRSQGLPVWGAGEGMDLELNRIFFLKKLEELGLDVPPYEIVNGWTALTEFLKDKQDIYIKMSKWRGCFDGETQIMTDSGWKYFDELLKTDKVATMNPETREMEFRLPDSHIKYWHDGEMVKIKGRKIDALVTPNHGFWSKSRQELKGWKYKMASELEGKQFSIPRSCVWSGKPIGTFTIPNVYKKGGVNKVVSADDWIEFLGWFVAEGSLNLASKYKNRYRVNIAQSKDANPCKYKRIQELILRMGFNPQIEGKIGFSIYNKSLWVELAKSCYSSHACDCRSLNHCCHTKRIPRYVFELNKSQIEIFFESYRLGDGCSDKGKFSYYTSSKLLADDVQELLSRIGKAGTIKSRIRNGGKIRGRQIRSFRPQYTITELTTNDIHILPSMMSRVPFSGYVYCVDILPYHSILVRRNGEMFWSGNSWETFHWRSRKQDWHNLYVWAVRFGGVMENAVFICFPEIETDLEIGADTYCINGQWPSLMEHGIERKDKAYFGAITKRDDMPKQLLEIMEAFSPYLESVGYACQWSMEDRVTKDSHYFIDATTRGGLPSTASFLNAKNVPEIIYYGARGELVEIDYGFKFSAECMVDIHGQPGAWDTIVLSDEVKENLMLIDYCEVDGQAWFPADDCGKSIEEIGWLRATGNTPVEVAKEMNRLADLLPDGANAAVEELADVFREIESEHEQGISFTEKPMPDPEIVLEPS